ncbi:MAG: site-specific DNA-methyltransferase [Dethiobacter sp.]|nr:MAG: site-specific DNA-methyltransferase [Dethiobacter sp.]
MYTEHKLIYADARELGHLKDNSIDLVVTSPPYPMIKMWDNLFTSLNPDIGKSLSKDDYFSSFELMHKELDKVWTELYRVMKNGSFVCINIGDATRTIKDRFQLYANHSRIQTKFFEIGFDVLPVILWRKQTNAPNKFMGSGMLPAGAYVTLEHEYILIFRKGNKRFFTSPDEKLNRMESALFWEERNMWYSDIWEDLKGTKQNTNDKELRQRSAAYPFLLPYRLINMYSVFGDTILDPFLGTGTSTFAAMACGRNSIGYEIDSSFSKSIHNKISGEILGLNNYNLQRINNHIAFVESFGKEENRLKYINEYFGFPVITKQETKMKLVFMEFIEEIQANVYRTKYIDDKHIQNTGIKSLSIDYFQKVNTTQLKIAF